MRPLRAGALAPRIVLLLLAAALSACQTTRAPDAAPPRGAPASYEVIAAAYNARTERLSRLWARSTVRFSARDENGKRVNEQGEGYLQIVLPDRMLLSIGAYVDRMYLYLGCNSDRYWWINTLDEGQEFALVGDMARASRETSARLGMPVHPLDLLELIGITGLPPEPRGTTWSEDGLRVRVEVPARWGSRRIEVNPVTFEPERIELHGPAGELVARAILSSHQNVKAEGGGLPPTLASRIVIDMPALEAEVILDIREGENSPRRPKTQVFDLETLIRSLRVKEIKSIDEPATPPPGATP